MIVNNQLCLRCGACVGSCPTNSIFLHENTGIEFTATCIECERCMIVCPVGSIGRSLETTLESGRNLSREARA